MLSNGPAKKVTIYVNEDTRHHSGALHDAIAEHLPVLIEFVETAAKVDEVLPALYDMVSDGLIEIQDTTIVKVARKERNNPEEKPAHERKSGPAKLIRVFLGEADRWNGEPLHEAIIKRLRMMDVCGATVYRGILGYGDKGHTRRQGILPLSRDLPIMISVVDSAEKTEQIT